MAFLDRDGKSVGTALGVRNRLDDAVPFDLVLLPAQLEGLRGSTLSGVPALLVAVLEEAIACLWAGARSTDSRRRTEAGRAERWFRSRDASYAFAFESICHALDVDPDALRAAILRQAGAPGSRARRRHEVPRGDRRLEQRPGPRRRRA